MKLRRVIKVGGSLFDLPDLSDRIKRWLESQPAAQNIFLAGGGEFCNHVRELQQRFQFSDQVSHELCIELMKVTSRILGTLCGFQVAEDLDSILNSKQDLVFDCSKWLSTKKEVPQNWDLTSDSISALLARDLAADLYLLKSTDSQDAVDHYFPIAAADVARVAWVNLRKV